MITKEYLRVWKGNNLVRASAESLKNVEISEASKQFLTEIGLPEEADHLLKFDLALSNLPTIARSPNNLKPYICIGSDYGTRICIDEENEGQIVSVDANGNLPTRFVNSSVTHLAESLTLFRKRKEELSANLSDEAFDQLINGLVQELSIADRRIFDNEENWWAVIFEQIRDGLL